MAGAAYVERVKDVLLGQGLGEKPSLRQCAASANVTVSGNKATFTMLAGEGSKIKAGHTLSTLGATDTAKQYSFYVLSVSTDTVTTVNGWLGSTIANASADLDGAILEQNAEPIEAQIHKRINTIFAKFLWPDAYIIDTGTIASPNLSTYQDELPATVQKLIGAHQIVGGEMYDIAAGIRRNVHTSISSTGVLGVFDYFDGSAAYYTFMRKLVDGDESADDALVELVAIGASALLLGADVSASNREQSKKDSQAKGRMSPANTLWRDFITLRNEYAEELGEETALGFTYHRG